MSSTQTPARPSENSPRREAGFQAFFRSSVIFTLGPVVGRALGIAVVPFVVESLGAEEFGRFELLSYTATAVAGLLLVGLDMSSISLFHRPAGRDPRQVFPTAIALGASLGLLSAMVIFLARGWISTKALGDSSYSTAVAMVGLYGLFSVIGLVGRAWLRVQERAGVHSLVSAVTALSTTALVIVVLIAGGSLQEILMAHVGGAIVGMLLALWFARDMFGAAPDTAVGRSLLVLGAPQLIAIFAIWGGEVLHRALLSELVGPEEVGALGIGARIAIALAYIAVGLQSAWHPRVFGLLDRPDGMSIVVKDAIRIGVLLSVAALALAVVAAPGVRLLGREEFTADTTAIAGWMVVMAAGTGFLQLATLHSVTEKKFGDTTTALFVGLVVSLGMAAWLVPGDGTYSGALGTAIAMAASQWIAATVGWLLAGRARSLRLPLSVAGPALVAMPACIVITSGFGLPLKIAVTVLALAVAAMRLWETRPTPNGQ